MSFDPDPDYAYTISYAGWTSNQKVYDEALNKDLLKNENATHFPIFKADTFEEFEQFQSNYENVFNLEQGYDNVLSFNDAINKAQINREVFFENYTLVLIYIPSNSSSIRYCIHHIAATENSICVYIEQKDNPEIIENNMAGWFILLTVEDEKAVNYNSFDAIFVP